LSKVDDYPLYSMRFQGESSPAAFQWDQPLHSSLAASSTPLAWGCSLFAAMGDPGNMLYGRNFDWNFSPALLLFTSPPGGYASVSMVDMAYLGIRDDAMNTLLEQPLEVRRLLLDAPELPFDGMNARGLVVGMAAVPGSEATTDAQKPTIDSLMVIRLILDHAGTVDEALATFEKYNLDWGSGPPLHYLVADTTGKAVLVEFTQGKMVVVPNQAPWHLATNFLVSPVKDAPAGNCPRYDRISRQLNKTGGRVALQDALPLLADVSAAGENSTQWSIIYQMTSGDVSVVMGRKYENVHHFVLTR
jgi:hypothetical protein